MKILRKIGNLVSEGGNKWFKTEKCRFISTRKAKEIQKSANHIEVVTSDLHCTPPYVEIATQLNKNNEQLFRAAVYNLYKTAEQNPQYKQAIIEVLEPYTEDMSLDVKIAEYLKEKFAMLKKL